MISGFSRETCSSSQIFMWCIQKLSKCLCYLNDNSKEITTKMIPCKCALSCGSSLEVWNIDRSASSWCLRLPLQHMSCLYSCAHIYNCSEAVCVCEIFRLEKCIGSYVIHSWEIRKYVYDRQISRVLHIFHHNPLQCTRVAGFRLPSIHFLKTK